MKVVIIGVGGVGTVVAHKCAQHPEVFSEIVLASRTLSKCEAVAKATGASNISCDTVDADDVEQVVALFERHKPKMVINVALPYQDLTIMEACLRCGVNYLDTANYEPRDEAHFEYSWQWAYRERFEKAGLTAILGCGFDPGVSGVFTAYAAKHHFSEMHTLDIVDCNAGNHGKAFATNFNPEINIREITQRGRYYKDGQWVSTEPLEHHMPITYPNIGERESYILYHEELESLVLNYPTIRRARFWMTFGQEYLTHLRVIQNIGMARIDEVDYKGVKIVPLQFLKAVLPDPQDLGENYHGQRRQAPHILYIQQLLARGSLPRDRHAGRELHHRRAGHGGRHDVPHRQMGHTRRAQRRGVRSRPLPRRRCRQRPPLARSHAGRPRSRPHGPVIRISKPEPQLRNSRVKTQC